MKIRAAILVMKDWKERAFLRAELIEHGIRTLAVETIDDADEWVSDDRVIPLIVIYDNRFQDNPFEDIKRLRKYVSTAPILILAGAEEKNTSEIRSLGFAHIILRPASIGEVVKKVKEILGLAYRRGKS
jgi:DNA-binding response OmpR family regulator